MFSIAISYTGRIRLFNRGALVATAANTLSQSPAYFTTDSHAILKKLNSSGLLRSWSIVRDWCLIADPRYINAL